MKICVHFDDAVSRNGDKLRHFNVVSINETVLWRQASSLYI